MKMDMSPLYAEIIRIQADLDAVLQTQAQIIAKLENRDSQEIYNNIINLCNKNFHEIVESKLADESKKSSDESGSV